jgi:ketosteroid isomerase-like protein
MATEGEYPVRRFAERISDSDPDGALEVCDPQIEFLSVLALGGQAYRGHDGIRQYFADIASAWSEWRVEVHRVSSAPDGRVVIVMTMHCRGKESGTTLAERTGHVWTLRNGRLWRNQPYRDPEQALRKVGLSP